MAIFLLHRSKRREADQSPYQKEHGRETFVKAFAVFWKKNPAFLYGTLLALGAGVWFFLTLTYLVITIVSLLGVSLIFSHRKMWLTIVIPVTLLLGYFYAYTLYPDIRQIPEKTKGQGYFVIQSVKPFRSTFQKGQLYQGYFRSFISDESNVYKNVPCSIFIKNNRYLANTDYLIAGELLHKPQSFSCIFKPNKSTNWTPISNAFQFSQTRSSLKNKSAEFLSKNLMHKRSSRFLSALVTGNLTDLTLKFEFSRLGLQHILAISGFHFGLLLYIFSAILTFIFPKKWVLVLLLVLANLYYLFIGDSPSIQRAWIMIQLYLIAQLFSKRIFAMNFLGFAILVEVLFDPLVVTSVGFILSFFACFAIFLFYSPMESCLSYLLPRRSKKETQNWPRFLKAGALLSNFFRKSLSLMLAIDLVLIPILLYYFHYFPFLSLIYNLFFPPMVGICLFLLVMACLCSPIPFVGALLFQLTDSLTYYLLELVAFPPMILDYQIRFQHISLPFLALFLGSLFLIGVVWNNSLKSQLTFSFDSDKNVA